jgi:hypothetical protein
MSDIQKFTDKEFFQNLTKEEKLGFFGIVRSFIRPGLPFEPSLGINFHYDTVIRIGSYVLPVAVGHMISPALAPYLIAVDAGVFCWNSYKEYKEALQEAETQLARMYKVCGYYKWESIACEEQMKNAEKAMEKKAKAQW